MISGSRVTPEMLGRPISEANLGDIAGILGMLLEASGISRPFDPAGLGPHPVFPPSPCHLATQALYMTVITSGSDKQHWQNIYNDATALCSG
jgi:hypothetical protein